MPPEMEGRPGVHRPCPWRSRRLRAGAGCKGRQGSRHCQALKTLWEPGGTSVCPAGSSQQLLGFQVSKSCSIVGNVCWGRDSHSSQKRPREQEPERKTADSRGDFQHAIAQGPLPTGKGLNGRKYLVSSISLSVTVFLSL